VIHNLFINCGINTNQQNFMKLWLQLCHTLPHWQ